MSHSSNHHHHHAEHRSERRSEHTAHRHTAEHGGIGPQVKAQVRGSTAEIAEYLTALAEAMRSGGVQIRAGDRAVGLHLADQLSFELRTESSDGQTNRIAVMITWETESPRASAATLHISSLQAPAYQAGRNSALTSSGQSSEASTTTNSAPPLSSTPGMQLPDGEGQNTGEGQTAPPPPAEGDQPASDATF